MPYFPDDQNDHYDLYYYDYPAQTYLRITNAPDGLISDGDSGEPFMAANGNAVVFASEATNLVAGDMNGMTDILLWVNVR